MRVEVQFRTIAMDFWASLEHKLKYKKDIDNAQVISQDLCFCAELISQLDGRMQQIRERLEEKKDDTQSNITGVWFRPRMMRKSIKETAGAKEIQVLWSEPV